MEVTIDATPVRKNGERDSGDSCSHDPTSETFPLHHQYVETAGAPLVSSFAAHLNKRVPRTWDGSASKSPQVQPSTQSPLESNMRTSSLSPTTYSPTHNRQRKLALPYKSPSPFPSPSRRQQKHNKIPYGWSFLANSKLTTRLFAVLVIPCTVYLYLVSSLLEVDGVGVDSRLADFWAVDPGAPSGSGSAKRVTNETIVNFSFPTLSQLRPTANSLQFKIPRVIEDFSTMHSFSDDVPSGGVANLRKLDLVHLPTGPLLDEMQDEIDSTVTETTLLPAPVAMSNSTSNITSTNATAATSDEEDDEDGGVAEDKGDFHIDSEHSAKAHGNNEEKNAEDSGIAMDDEVGGDFSDDENHGYPCEDAEDWQSASYPNCNTMHELDLDPSQSHSPSLMFLGQGWFRSAWKMERSIPLDKADHDALREELDSQQADTKYWQERVVFKMLRLEREFLDEYYELHRRDAVAMEHLTFSNFVMDVYGYCGQSAINELADFRDGINSLEQLDRRMRGKEGHPILILKIRLALSVAIGLYHVHYGRPGLPWDHKAQEDDFHHWRPTMAHYDLNPRNIAIVGGGRPRLNDFNIAEFLQYPKDDAASSSTCGFPSRLHEPWWRAPEEMNVTASPQIVVNEKVDVYALGSVLFHILTTHSPRGKMKKERMNEVRTLVVDGVRPTLMEPWASSKDGIVKAFRKAMQICHHPDPEERGTAAEVAIILHKALENALSAPDEQPKTQTKQKEKEKKNTKTEAQDKKIKKKKDKKKAHEKKKKT